MYKILNFMTRDSVYTHQIPRVMKECAPHLLSQHPQLATVVIEGVTPENFCEKLESLCAEYGETLLVTQLPLNAHESIDPESELAEKVHPDRIIKLNVGPTTAYNNPDWKSSGDWPDPG